MTTETIYAIVPIKIKYDPKKHGARRQLIRRALKYSGDICSTAQSRNDPQFVCGKAKLHKKNKP